MNSEWLLWIPLDYHSTFQSNTEISCNSYTLLRILKDPLTFLSEWFKMKPLLCFRIDCYNSLYLDPIRLSKPSDSRCESRIPVTSAHAPHQRRLFTASGSPPTVVRRWSGWSHPQWKGRAARLTDQRQNQTATAAAAFQIPHTAQ